VESLGVRPSVVRLSLYRREAMEKLGRIVGVEHPVDEAIAIGMRTPDASTIVSRTIIARVLSIIYFPFWIVGIDGPSGSRLAVVDAIGDTVVRLDAPPSLTTRLDRTAEGESEIVGFRPLACPNCGADLPVAADDVIFYCASCERAWHLHGVDFDPVPIEVADVKPAGKATDVRYLPCWVLTTEAAGTPTRLFAPAFRFQRLRGLSELARRLTRSQPSWGPLVGSKPPLRGCYYDVEDAWLLARFTEAGLRVTVRDPAAPDDTSVAVPRATLTWLPFTVELRELIDPFTNMALPEAGLR
jgi:hypothetical protein